MGMGGSSLFPEVLARTFAPAPARPRAARARHHRPGGHRAHRRQPARPSARCTWRRRSRARPSRRAATSSGHGRAPPDPGRFAVVTDPGSELGRLAPSRGFAEVFENRADIGGRYSALSLFGVVPALLMGVDVAACCWTAPSTRSRAAARACPPADNPALRARRRDWPPGCARAATRPRSSSTRRGGHPRALARAARRRVARQGRHRGRADRRRARRRRPRCTATTGFLPRASRWPTSTRAGRRRSSAADVRSAPTPDAIGQLVVPSPSWPPRCRRRPRRAAVRPARRGGREGGHQRGARRGRAPPSTEQPAGRPARPSSRPGDHLALQVFVDPGGHTPTCSNAARIALRDRHRVAT